MFGEMLALEKQSPEMYKQFTDDNFTARLTDNHAFNRIEPDKEIEVTLNKYSKTVGLKRNEGTVNWWKLNSSYRANIRVCLNEFLNHLPDIYKHPDLSTYRIKKDETDMNSIINTINEIYPFSSSELVIVDQWMMASNLSLIGQRLF